MGGVASEGHTYYPSGGPYFPNTEDMYLDASTMHPPLSGSIAAINADTATARIAFNVIYSTLKGLYQHSSGQYGKQFWVQPNLNPPQIVGGPILFPAVISTP